MGGASGGLELGGGEEVFKEGLAGMRQAGDEVGIAMGLLGLARVMQAKGITSQEGYRQAESMCSEARVLCRRHGDLYGLAEVLVEEGNLARIQGNFLRAAECLEENLALRRELGDKSGTGKALNYLGRNARDAGDLVQA